MNNNNINEQLLIEARAWLTSQAGKDEFSKAFEEVKIMSTALEKARELTPESLYEPVTL